jgi:hypothetical protein
MILQEIDDFGQITGLIHSHFLGCDGDRTGPPCRRSNGHVCVVLESRDKARQPG